MPLNDVRQVKNPITVQHGSADTVVRAINVEYRKWRWGVHV